MKTRAITITKANINSIYGRMKKFFYNNNNTGFTSWHNFNCGFKRVNPIVEISGDKMRLERTYPAPLKVALSKNYEKQPEISVTLTAADGFVLGIGDKVAFCGNRIIIRDEFYNGFRKPIDYCYMVYQAFPMSIEEQDMKQEMIREEEDAYWDAYEDDLEDEYVKRGLIADLSGSMR